MIFRNRLEKNPQTLIRLGMLCLLIGIAAPWFLHPATDFWQGVLDGVRGAFLGAAIALNLWGARLAGRRRCGDGS